MSRWPQKFFVDLRRRPWEFFLPNQFWLCITFHLITSIVMHASKKQSKAVRNQLNFSNTFRVAKFIAKLLSIFLESIFRYIFVESLFCHQLQSADHGLVVRIPGILERQFFNKTLVRGKLKGRWHARHISPLRKMIQMTTKFSYRFGAARGRWRMRTRGLAPQIEAGGGRRGFLASTAVQGQVFRDRGR